MAEGTPGPLRRWFKDAAVSPAPDWAAAESRGPPGMAVNLIRLVGNPSEPPRRGFPFLDGYKVAALRRAVRSDWKRMKARISA